MFYDRVEPLLWLSCFEVLLEDTQLFIQNKVQFVFAFAGFQGTTTILYNFLVVLYDEYVWISSSHQSSSFKETASI